MPPQSKRSVRTKLAELAEVQALLLLLRPLLSSGSLRSELEAAVAAAPLAAPSASRSTAGHQVMGTRQHDEDAGWKRVQHSKKAKEEASQPALREKLLEDGGV